MQLRATKLSRRVLGNMKEVDITLKKTKNKGTGLFTTRDIKKGEHLFHVDLRGLDRYTVEEIDALSKSNPYIDGDHSNYVGWGKYVIEDTMPSYMNHSCDPNCIYKMRSIAVYDVYAIRNIKKDEELTHDYGATAIDQLQGYFYWEDECFCGSDNCRKVIHGNFFKLPRDWQRKYYPNLPPSIKHKYREHFKELMRGC